MYHQPGKISRRCKEEQSFVQYITTEEADNKGGDLATSCSRASVFNRLQPFISQGCPSMFNRIGEDKAPKLSVFQRLERDSQPKPSVFTIIARGKKPSGSSPAQIESSVFNRLGETNEVQSCVPSRMKRVSTLDVKIDGSLKVKKHTLVITNYDASANSKEEIKDEDQVSFNHITIREADVLEIEVEPAEAPKTLKDGGHSIIDELKELNLGMKEDQRPIYVSTMLTPEEEKQYFHLPSKYRDVFAWSYK